MFCKRVYAHKFLFFFFLEMGLSKTDEIGGRISGNSNLSLFSQNSNKWWEIGYRSTISLHCCFVINFRLICIVLHYSYEDFHIFYDNVQLP